ncbi:O-methyltransferase [Nonomuraea sp. NPDC050404]|uniref:O-methyltransferase n=1 Tax=Nonomuraea sp. NPDC050404 TaxID=3155783 RepID=UPI003410AD40
MAAFAYSARPSKAVQRHMVVDVCRRLIAFNQLKSYQYVGFGGIEFIDFEMVHRGLGITTMTSIESDRSIDRYRFNAPFKAITVLPGRACDQLPSLDWDRPSIVWLDYVSRLNEEVISDIRLLCGRLMSGSALFVTVNCHPLNLLQDRLEDLARMIGEDRVPPGVSNDSLAVWGLAEVQGRVMSDLITAGLRERTTPARWAQVLDIYYADNAKMQTLGGIVVSREDQEKFETCRFEELDFVRLQRGAPLKVRVPLLTAKERRALEEQLPLASGQELKADWLSEADRSAYMQVYRYCATP